MKRRDSMGRTNSMGNAVELYFVRTTTRMQNWNLNGENIVRVC